jgi:hypothetical protein
MNVDVADSVSHINIHKFRKETFMLANFPPRKTRRFFVYKDRLPVLMIADQPGRLHSNAGPAPSGPPAHPFLDGTALDALSEHDLYQLLRQSPSFDEFLANLIAHGYDIGSDDLLVRSDPGPCARLADASGVLGALWHRAGQFTSLARQPAPGQLVFETAAVSLYREDSLELVLSTLAKAHSYRELVQALEAQGIHLQALDR